MWQTGTTHSSAVAANHVRLPVRAYFIHAGIGRTFDGPWSPRLSLSYARASGDGRSRSYGRFDTLYGARVFEYEPSSLYGPISRANLSSPEARLEVTPSKRWDGYFAFRPLWLENATDAFAATRPRDPSGASGRYAGTQVDLHARHWLKPGRVRLGSGLAMLVKGDFLRNARRAPEKGDTSFGYAEITHRF